MGILMTLAIVLAWALSIIAVNISGNIVIEMIISHEPIRKDELIFFVWHILALVLFYLVTGVAIEVLKGINVGVRLIMEV